jgi:hypothetical protein
VTDRPGSPDPEAGEPPEIADVRRLLADARHTGPMPEDVVARMDRVIAGLADETPGAETDPRPVAAVVPIAARRRRRAAALLVAAAAVVVGGVALGPHLPRGGSASPTGASAQDSGGRDTGSELGPTGHTGNSGNSVGGGTSDGPALAPSGKGSLRHGRVVVRPQQFPSAALQGQRLLARNTQSMDRMELAAIRGCSGLPQDAKAVAAEYQHAPAALVYRRAVGSAQVVDLYVCGSTRPIRSTTLPAP